MATMYPEWLASPMFRNSKNQSSSCAGPQQISGTHPVSSVHPFLVAETKASN